MLIEDIHPRIRFAAKLEYRAARSLSKTYDSRFLYVTSGSGSISVDGKETLIEQGLLVIFQGGTPYKFNPDPEFTAYAVDFDLTDDYDCEGGFLAPVPCRLFNDSLCHKRVVFDNSPFLSAPFIDSVAHHIGEKVRALTEEYLSSRPYGRKISELMLASTLLELARNYSMFTKGEKTAMKVCEYLSEHYREPISNADLAAHFGHDPCYLNRLITKHIGVSIHKLLVKKRVEAGVRLLITTDLTLDEIAERTGFCSAAHFSKRCRAFTGKNPNCYRKP